MARSLPLVMVLVAVFFLALVPAPLVSGGIQQSLVHIFSTSPFKKNIISSSLGRVLETKGGKWFFERRQDAQDAFQKCLQELHGPDAVQKCLQGESGPGPDAVQKCKQGSSGPVGLDDVQKCLQKVVVWLRDHMTDGSGEERSADDKAPRAANTFDLYIFNLSVGTPKPQNVAGVLDISSSFVCVNYGGGTNTTGSLANVNFTFGGPTSRVGVPVVVFDCSYASSGDFSGASASFGFGRGPWSLVSQLQLSWFSYHLAWDGSGLGGGEGNLLQFGGDDVFPRSSQGRSTPFVHNSRHPGRYYVKLKGIQVDDRDLTGIPAGTFDLQADGSGGVFLSTTIPATYLEVAAYKVVRQAFVNGIASKPDNGTAPLLCYKMPLKVPKLTLVFDGGATSTSTATMELKKSNYFLADSDTGLECLTIFPSRGFSVLGSLLQTGTNMTYDISRDQLVFETAFAPTAPTAFAPTAFAPPHYSKMSMSLMVLSPLVAWVLLF